MQRSLLLGVGAVVLAAVAVAVALGLTLRGGAATPAAVAERYLAARYANHAEQVYRLASSADRARRTLDQHLRLNPPFPEQTRPVVDELGRHLRITGVDDQRDGSQAYVTVTLAVPNANAPVVLDLLHATGSAADLGTDQRLARLRELLDEDAVPFVTAEQEVELVRERGRWAVVMQWADAVRFGFAARVEPGQPWAFSVDNEAVTLRPGELAQVMYEVTNLSSTTLTGKAVHQFVPPEAEQYVELVQCFCFFQDTVAAGQTKQLPLALRLSWDAPPDLHQVTVSYVYATLAD